MDSNVKTQQDVMDMLTQLQAKYKDGGDHLSMEEKKRHCDMLQNVLGMVRPILMDLKRSIESEHAGMVLQIKNLPSDGTGSVLIPKKEEIERIFTDGPRDNYSRLKGGIVPDVTMKIDVESVFIEWNFPYISNGPKSPNFITKYADVFVKFGSTEQAAYVFALGRTKGGFSIQVKGEGCIHGVSLKFVLCPDAATRTAYRTAGTLILRLKEVDAQLRALGAIPGRGGVPELSDMLVQKEDFDVAVTQFDAATLHNFLCTRTRVDKRKRQGILKPLVDERFEILLQLAKIDQDATPFTYEREF